MGKNLKVWVSSEGANELRRAPEMQAILKDLASDMASQCGDGYSYEVVDKPTRAIAIVFPETQQALTDNNQNNTILRSMK